MTINWAAVDKAQQDVISAINNYYKICNQINIPTNYQSFIPKHLIDEIIIDSQTNQDEVFISSELEYQSSDFENSY